MNVPKTGDGWDPRTIFSEGLGEPSEYGLYTANDLYELIDELGMVPDREDMGRQLEEGDSISGPYCQECNAELEEIETVVFEDTYAEDKVRRTFVYENYCQDHWKDNWFTYEHSELVDEDDEIN